MTNPIPDVPDETLNPNTAEQCREKEGEEEAPPPTPHSDPQSPKALQNHQITNLPDPDSTNPNQDEDTLMEDQTQLHNTDDPEPDAPPAAAAVRRAPKRKKLDPKRTAQEKKAREKLQVLVETLKPVLFVPSKVLDFESHKSLLQRLGLWDFVHLEFDPSIRADLVAQLIAGYVPSSHGSYVNGVRIGVNRSVLCRYLKLPMTVKKKNSPAASVGEGGEEALDSRESIAFVDELVSNWMLLHDDTYIMPDEVSKQLKLIKEGNLEMVDWLGLVWSMMEKELKSPQLENCYYASHFQHLIKTQRKELLEEAPEAEREEEVEAKGEGEEVEAKDEGEEVEAKDEEEEGEEEEEEDAVGDEVDGSGDVKMGGVDESRVRELEEHNIELSLGQDNNVERVQVEKEQSGGEEAMDFEQSKEEEQGMWLLDQKCGVGEPFLRPCPNSDVKGMDCGQDSAYDFLLYNGYINFGVSPSFTSQLPEPTEGTVIVIGAGLAGLAAARQLLSFGYKVVVLEGRNRPGGRVYTQKVGREGKFAAMDLGGSVITGIHANPLGVLARQLSIPLHKVRDNCPLYKPNGAPVDKETDASVEFVFNRLLDKVMELRQIMGGFASDTSLGSVLEKLKLLYAVAQSTDEKQLLDWHLANLEYANAGCLSNLSAAYWDQDDPYEMGGDHCFLAGGNWRLIKALCEGVPIFYEKTVNTIRYGNEGVEVIAGDQVFQADIALCTVPLGVLKKKTISFEPELPARKLEAIERLGFGLLNKVAMVFPYVFWGEDLDTFGCLSENSHQRGEYFLFYSYHTVSGGAALIALVAGEAAQNFESTDPSILLHRVLTVLKGIFHPKGITVPDPIQTICTRWGSDPLSYGSYSHVSVQSSGGDYDILAENVGNRLFFAGEATSRQYPATMHGAFLSGLREASHIYQSARVQQNYPRKSLPKNTGPSNDTLVDLFEKPDLECGKFAFIFDPSSESPQSMGILQITFGGDEETYKELLNSYPNPTKWPLQLYTIISREQVHQLQQIEGGDESRLSYLMKNLGLKLMGSNALYNAGNSLIACVAGSQKTRGRNRIITG